eukprot:677925_1
MSLNLHPHQSKLLYLPLTNETLPNLQPHTILKQSEHSKITQISSAFFDVVTGITHSPYSASFLSALFRVLKPGGVIMIQINHETQLKPLLSSAGFIDIQYSQINHWTARKPKHDTIEFTVFKSKTKCKSTTSGSCPSIKRLRCALKYYHSLDVECNEDHQQNMVQFCNETYTSLIDDFIHIIIEHNTNLEPATWQYQLEPCSLLHCRSLRRHHRDRRTETILTDGIQIHDFAHDDEFVFYRDTMDSVHCYLYHLYDMGLRVKLDQAPPHSVSDSNEEKNTYFDDAFSRMYETINQRKQSLKMNKLCMNRYKTNKFSIMHMEPNYDDFTHHDEDMTLLDALYQYMHTKGISWQEIAITRDIMADNGYDSETLLHELGIVEEMECNTKQLLWNHLYDVIAEFAKYHQLSEQSFSIGYVFNYWPFYKEESREQVHMSHFANANDMSGYSPQELYIELKYKSLKDEMLNNTIYSLNINLLSISLIKANEYINKDAAKQIKALHEWPKDDDPLHYGIKKGTRLSLANLLSVILYCDWSDMCTAFSKTFRKIKSYESLESIKKRNREFANWSKILRETVQYFGQRGFWEGMDEKANKYNKRVDGPFFCGMSVVMVIPEFNIHLCAPTSTSKEICVASRFASSDGIVIQLNNNGHYHSDYVRSFNCSWISDFAGEDEWLFIGGDWPIKIESIINIQTKQNFKDIYRALFYFDCMINGAQMKARFNARRDITDEECLVLNDLIKHKLNMDGFVNKYNQYINDTFDAFTNHKTQIALNYHFIEVDFYALKKFILSSNNLFKPIVFKLFRNVKHIIIHSTGFERRGSQPEFAINVHALLALLESCSSSIQSNLQITIKARHKYKSFVKKKYTYHIRYGYEHVDVSWISKLWIQSRNAIKSAFNAKHYHVSLIQKNQKFDAYNSLKEDWFIIKKLHVRKTSKV